MTQNALEKILQVARLLTFRSHARFSAVRKIKNVMKQKNFFDLQAGDTTWLIKLFFVL